MLNILMYTIFKRTIKTKFYYSFLLFNNGINVQNQIFILFVEYAQLFAALIARTAKDIDVLIDSLPSEESTATLQVSGI